MRILFVTPYPPSRIRVRGYEFLRQLRRKHEVTVLAQCASEQEVADAEKLRQQGYDVRLVEESKMRSAFRSGSALVRSRSLPLQVAYARSARVKGAVRQLYAEQPFDVIHVEHLRGIASMVEFAHHPLVWDAVDCISLLCKQTMTSGPSRAVRVVARLDYERTRRYEARVLKKLPCTVVTSERDRRAMIELLRTRTHDFTSSDEELGKHIFVLPNGVDLDYFRPQQQEIRPGTIVFSGKMSYHANVATALYLYQQIMPLIWQQRPEVKLTIVGSKPPKSILALAEDSRVEVTGYVEDIRPYIARAEVMLSPMVYSVGIQNKVLEAMALGTPVVVAEQAASGLGVQAGHDLLVASTPLEFADAALRLLGNAELRASLCQRGRDYVERNHNWATVVERLEDLYRQVLPAGWQQGVLPVAGLTR
ncbi:MAG TPA: glycosyltransferase [Ktedonobacteraceae bacterium]|nr:glycosyltransferase [Ktedonobacteraceae bacterium]